MKLLKFPIRYVPKILTKKDKKQQVKMLIKSKKLYKNHKYYIHANMFPLIKIKNQIIY